jgi:hypothetical protein
MSLVAALRLAAVANSLAHLSQCMYLNIGRKKEDERQSQRDGGYMGDSGALHLPSRLHSRFYNKMLSLVRAPELITDISFVELKAQSGHHKVQLQTRPENEARLRLML